jgi:glycosyltransferase involved in cell wall biosynthesis
MSLAPFPSRIALVHDWLTGMRGGEKVLEVLCERYPDARLFTLVHVRGSTSPAIDRRAIRTAALQGLPGVRRYYRQCLPLFPMLVEQFDLDEFDLVISSSHCAAKAVIPAPRAVHVCYCHTPMRYAWDQFDAYFGRARLGPIGNRVLRSAMARLARWDRDTSRRVTRYVTNSEHVARRIRRYYHRDATVVYPPVDTDYFCPRPVPTERYALIVSALVPYKRVDVAIAACRLAGVPLKIVGDGPERGRLQRMGAGHTHEDPQFLGRVPDAEIRELYRRAAVVLLPGEEDLGIVPLEAQASGRPVVALGRGGAVETVVPDETGILVGDATPQAFAGAIRSALDRAWDPAVIRRHAERFGRARFGQELQTVIDEAWRDARAT